MVIEGMRGSGLSVWTPWLEKRTPAGSLAILDGLEAFREHLGGDLALTLPTAIGAATEVHELAPETVEKGVAMLKRANAACKVDGQ